MEDLIVEEEQEEVEEGERVVFATGGYDPVIRLWDVVSGRCLHSLAHAESHVNALAVSRDKRTLLAGGIRTLHLLAVGYGAMRIYDATGGISDRPLHIYEGHRGNVTSVGFQREGRWLWSAGDDGTVRLWDVRSPVSQRELKNTPRLRVTDGGRTMHLPDSAVYFMRRDIPVPIHSAVLHPNQVECLTADDGGVVALWDLAKQSVTRCFLSGSRSAVKTVAVAPDGQHIAAGNYDV